jgi:hypothetical protein
MGIIVAHLLHRLSFLHQLSFLHRLSFRMHFRSLAHNFGMNWKMAKDTTHRHNPNEF